jgi:protein-disulfide isomerase
VLAIPVGPGDHTQGPAGSPVTLVLYGDFECPFSRKARTVIRAVRSRRGDSFRYVFRNFPLEDQHPHAFRAAEAAEAAGAQGKYWEMHHLLYDTPWALEDDDLEHYAARIGLDLERFRRDMAEHTHTPRIRADMDGGVRSGVHGTPTYVVNGVSYVDLEDDPQWLIDALDRAA